MRIYARAWIAVAILLGALGAAMTLLAVSPIAAWTAGLVGAALTGVSYLCRVARHEGAPARPRRALLVVVLGGVVGATTTGLTALLGGGAVVLVALMACAHPWVLRGATGQVRRLLGLGDVVGPTRPGKPRVLPAPGPVAQTGSTVPRDWASKAIPGAAYDQHGPHDADLRGLSLPELCWGWRASFMALERADSRTEYRRWDALVTVRRCYLDEIARRDPAGFARWIYAGARPASDPSRYLFATATQQPTAPAVPSVPSREDVPGAESA